MRETDKKYAVAGVEVMRCMADGRLMTEWLCRTGLCAGHKLAQPAYPSLLDLLLLRLRVYEVVKFNYWRLLAWLSR